ncbi:carbohydrate ABC transporter permease [Ktedonobacter racemifer]|uniref:Binding-protein-dependent transport systems inner membrane component n=1 Tax=Ktedonobacter racemifer DSM 44963 TaxID=485913 RepID=D6TX72_KTERA|nr:sugar ABC transporter permease [Ktedonobacter racemifer]EFH84805.1 binding-protein-dependent transport systems inner membrane component [Ktedonobacter racemifer DSM 44963]
MSTLYNRETTMPAETKEAKVIRKRTAARARGEPAEWVGYLFIAPNFIGFLFFTLLPLIFALVIAFTRWDVVSGLGGIQWIGLQNFVTLLHDPNFWESARITLIYVGISVPLTTVAGLLVALALNGPIPGRAVLRVIFFIPFIANSVAIATTWILLYHPTYGPINTILKALGVSQPPLWLVSSQWALPALIFMAVWSGVGYASIIYLAALQDVPQELHEAAAIDGAGAWARFRVITLPFLSPAIFFLLVTGFIGASQNFGMINLMTQGGPGRSTTVLSYYIYQSGFQFYRFGYAAAMAWVMFLAVLLLTLLLWRIQRRGIFYS